MTGERFSLLPSPQDPQKRETEQLPSKTQGPITRNKEATLTGSRLATEASEGAATWDTNKSSRRTLTAIRAAGGPAGAIHEPQEHKRDWRPGQVLPHLAGGGAFPGPCPPWQHVLSMPRWLETRGSGTPVRSLTLSSSYLPFNGSPAPHQVTLAL